MKKILILHTGGTISMVQGESGVETTHTTHPLESQMNHIPKNICVDVEDIFNLPSPHITINHMLLLKNRIEKAIDCDYDGVVITHGTDTLEETAYFLDLTVDTSLITVVITGAMRSSNEVGADGLYNFNQAVRTASDDKAKSQGVLVVMNDEIHAAKFVTKTHTTNVGTFRTPTFGPVGLLSKKNVNFFNSVLPKQIFSIDNVQGVIPIIKVYAGMDETLFDLLANQPIDGIVVEALGAGNVPPNVLLKLGVLIEQGVPVALVSRCTNGIAEAIYSYEGGGVQLKHMGVMFVKGLSGQKARIKLLVGLNAGLSDDALKQYMED